MFINSSPSIKCMTQNEFEKFNISQELLEQLKQKGYQQPTAIQNKAIPYIVKGESVIVTSATGSGKTLCYTLPIVSRLISNNSPQILVIAPTKSLVQQIEKEFNQLNINNILTILASYGGSSYKQDLETAHQADIIIGTTGRISDLIENRAFQLGTIKTIILDEIDEMLYTQYLVELEFILKQIPKKSQKLVFSATISKETNKIIRNYIKNPKKITAQQYISPKKLKQEVYTIESAKKLSLLLHILESRKMGLIMIFVNRQDTVEWLAKNLDKLSTYKTRALHGDTSPGKRKKIINEFDNEQFDILVTTDIAARGLDISGITHIINYTIPKIPDKYIHRIGRTARAGETGTIINFVAKNEEEAFLEILRNHDIKPVIKDLPEFREVEPITTYKEKKPRR